MRGAINVTTTLSTPSLEMPDMALRLELVNGKYLFANKAEDVISSEGVKVLQPPFVRLRL